MSLMQSIQDIIYEFCYDCNNLSRREIANLAKEIIQAIEDADLFTKWGQIQAHHIYKDL